MGGVPILHSEDLINIRPTSRPGFVGRRLTVDCIQLALVEAVQLAVGECGLLSRECLEPGGRERQSLHRRGGRFSQTSCWFWLGSCSVGRLAFCIRLALHLWTSALILDPHPPLALHCGCMFCIPLRLRSVPVSTGGRGPGPRAPWRRSCRFWPSCCAAPGNLWRLCSGTLNTLLKGLKSP